MAFKIFYAWQSDRPIDLIVPEDDDVEGRRQPPPNPNVMLEYGYALDALGNQRLIGVFNKAFGKPDDLPFDLRHRRWPIQYRADASDDTDPMQQLCDRAVALIKKGTDAFIAAVEHRGVDPVEIQRLRDALIMRVVGIRTGPGHSREMPQGRYRSRQATPNHSSSRISDGAMMDATYEPMRLA